jgi:hypothetical protein
MFGLDGAMSDWAMMRAYGLSSNRLLFEWPFHIGPISDERTSDGKLLRPAFGMECDISAYIHSYNKTQHFYTVLPRAAE